MDAIGSAVESLRESIKSGNVVNEELIQQSENGISLLALKNDALLSYVNNLLLLAGAQLEQEETIFTEARKRSIEQRVTLEKGVKGLEAKISYQVDKALRAYRKSVDQAAQKATEADESENSHEDSDSDFDPATFRPNVATMQKRSKSQHGGSGDESDGDGKKYIAPKISAAAPTFEKAKRQPPRRRNFAMEEYIRETGDAPIAEPSIGSQIMDGGRGGERTGRDRRRDKEIQEYEEANFTRISDTSTKRARKDAFRRQQDATTNNFFGEDWNFLDNDARERRGKQSQKKRRKH